VGEDGACKEYVDVVATIRSGVRPVVTDASPAGFVDFYRAEYRGALKLATMLVFDSQRAAELTQEVFAVAFRRWSQLGGYERPDLWVRRAVINRAISERRRRGSEAKALVRLGAVHSEEMPAAPDPFGLWRLVARLPRRQAQALVLVYGDDVSVDDAAKAMRCSAGSVKTHLHRGRLAVAALLKETE